MSLGNAMSRAYALPLAVLALMTAALGMPADAMARDLPDFTRLVEENAAAVVNISTVRHPDAPDPARPRSRNEELDEFFRRFFPPDRGGDNQPYQRPRSLGSGHAPHPRPVTPEP